ncbi:metal-dependent hydrolase [Haloarcula sp. S1AR25-5A]|uniref:Metal-dependent hydrolase n=1 Tax=Haloarcula terrestris TaxID=2950533 RepID=A0AAE4EY12_9EURY|nr:metal-dependent hydrolase [Haloarcula terrestris]MDS0221654.1 metal-dependent hydrolase [Haloarcula terrestris]
MYPEGHFLLAAVPLTAYTVARWRRLPSGPMVLLLLVATQLPDIIDKPLAWTFAILPSGRMLAHSLVVCLPLLSVLVLLAARRGYGQQAVVFSAAYLSHIAGDFYPVLRLGTEYYFFPNLFWPLLPANPDREASFAAHAPDSLFSLLVPLVVLGLAASYSVIAVYRRRERHLSEVPHQ